MAASLRPRGAGTSRPGIVCPGGGGYCDWLFALSLLVGLLLWTAGKGWAGPPARDASPKSHVSAAVDIVFVVNATASMEKHRKNLRASAGVLAKQLASARRDARYAVAVFRDRADGAADKPEEPFALKVGASEFSDDLNELMQALAKVKAEGGGLTERAFDALAFASKLPWRRDARKVMILVTDAPPRLPDRHIKNEAQLATLLKERRIDQLHVLHDLAPEPYRTLHRLLGKAKGRSSSLFPADLDAMRHALTDIGRDIAGIEPLVVAGAIRPAASDGAAKDELAVSDKNHVVVPDKKVEIPRQVLAADANKMDLVFVIDTTGSMDAHLGVLGGQVGRVGQALAASKIDYRIGVVAFRDRVDETPPNNEHRALTFADGSEFTRDPSELNRAVGALRAFGGGDPPESGLDALEFASRRAFRADARKVLILVSDDGPRVPDRDMKDEDQVARLLRERGIERLHLLIDADSDRYLRLAKAMPREGRVVELSRLVGAEGYKLALEEIAKTTIGGASAVVDRKFAIGGTKADLVFLVDTTGSMSDFPGSLQRPAERIAAKLHEERVDVRFCLISFRDRHPGDGNNPEDHKVIPQEGKEFSSKLDDFRRAVGALRADSGGDAPESGMDAMAFAAGREFRFDALRVLFLITDEGPKIPDKDMKDENDVLRVFKGKGIHQLHLIHGNNAERYFTLQRLMGRDGRPAGKAARLNDRNNPKFNTNIDDMAAAILDQLRTEGRVKLSENPLPPLDVSRNDKRQAMVDVMFVLDATANLEPEIAMVRSGVAKLMGRLSDLNLDVRLGASYFGNRLEKGGHVAEAPASLRFGPDEFTRNVDDFQRALGRLKARDGGGDDIGALGALAYASKRPYRKGAYRVMILVAGAPPRMPEGEWKDEFQLGEMVRQSGIHQLHLLLKTAPHRYVTVQRFLTNDASPAGLHFDLEALDRSDRTLSRLFDSVSRAIVSDAHRALAARAAGAAK